jgi:hypothetical protein
MYQLAFVLPGLKIICVILDHQISVDSMEKLKRKNKKCNVEIEANSWGREKIVF